MVSQQVITFSPDGTISGLQVKPGRGVDLSTMGKAKIVRASEIVWDEDKQAWTIVIQDAPGLDYFKGIAVTTSMACKAGINQLLIDYWMAEKAVIPHPDGVDEPLWFASYDDAVKFEIAYLDAWRLKGVH